MSKRFEARPALVTGGASGIGAATVRALVVEGARVVIADIDLDAAQALASELPGRTLAVRLDVANEPDWDRALSAAAETFGNLELLVNCAGVGGGHDVEHETLEHFDRVISTNLTGAFLGCRAALAAMRRAGRGAIVNVASAAAIKPLTATPAYSAAKAGLVQLTRCIALHCAEQKLHVHCNAVLPGVTDTPRLNYRADEFGGRDAMLSSLIDRWQPAGRAVRPDEVAAAILYFLSDEARMAVGAALTLDGGFSL